MSLHSFFKKLRKKNLQGGFSLIELLVVLGIFTIFTATILVKQGSFNSSVALTNLAHNIAGTIRQAQVYGLGAREVEGVSSEFSSAYGVRIGYSEGEVNRVSSTKYIFCSDEYNFNTICNGTYELLETFTIGKGNKVESICGYWGPSLDCQPVNNNVDIYFKRPNPEAIIWKDASTAEQLRAVEITVSNADGSYTKNITVNETGLITVDSSGSASLPPESDYTLTVNSSGATGVTITGTHPGTTNYSAEVGAGTSVSITAPYSVGSNERLYSISGCDSRSGYQNTTCHLTVNSDRNVTAYYNTGYQLTVTNSGGGTVTSDTPGEIDCGSNCSHVYSGSDNVTLTATPDTGYTFSGWAGDCSGTGDCYIDILNTARTAIATFQLPASVQHTVDVSFFGSPGTGSVIESTPAGIYCISPGSGVCSYDFDENSTVWLQASGNQNSAFRRWVFLDCIGGTNPYPLGVGTSDKSCIAEFTGTGE